jgi:HlyD family secretion protein
MFSGRVHAAGTRENMPRGRLEIVEDTPNAAAPPDVATPRGGERGASDGAGRSAAPVREQVRRAAARRRRRRRALALAVLFVAAAVAGVSWWRNRTAGQSAEGSPATAPVERRDFSSAVLATGAVQSQVGAEVRVGARISGKVERLHANIGDRVSRGDVIAELEKADLEATVAQRRAEQELAEARLAAVESLLIMEIEKAEVELGLRQATVTLTEHEFTRAEELVKNRTISRQDWDMAKERLAVARAQWDSARKSYELAQARFREERRQAMAEVARAKAAVDNAAVQLSYATITAPIEGVIASVATQEGETVAAGLNAPTFVTIIDLERLQVDAYVDEVDIGKVHPGQQAVFTVDAFPGREFKARVEAIYPKAIIQDNVVNYDVVLRIEEDYDGLLRPEMTAGVTIYLESRQDVLAVPARAIRREQGRSVVYVAGAAGPETRPVTVGWKDGPWIEVLAGLEEGEIVLLEPPAAPRP